MQISRRSYVIIWGDGFSTTVDSKSEALKIALDLLTDYDKVQIIKKVIYT
jgi:hypothetical protein